ncbi:uncharacterized protein LOC111830692 [Capsella rubella]|uniref:uncharacterized protein LOC111830692 n=1 Tax=Capsella rubella TaxID=81985 RepID=UPI000CD51FEC|nr:uncharacterized protein LOC111830692 [Capsella rubella]
MFLKIRDGILSPWIVNGFNSIGVGFVCSCKGSVSEWKFCNRDRGGNLAHLLGILRLLHRMAYFWHAMLSRTWKITVIAGLIVSKDSRYLFWLIWGDLIESNGGLRKALMRNQIGKSGISLVYEGYKLVRSSALFFHTSTLPFFFTFASSSPLNFYEEGIRVVQEVITEDTNAFLTAHVIEKEIHDAFFMMHLEKPPDPDGMNALFSQKAWKVIKEDRVPLVTKFFQEGCYDKRLNQTNICLIPKVERPSGMAELRPIRLCNVGYKVISKFLCQRLKTILPSLISET